MKFLSIGPQCICKKLAIKEIYPFLVHILPKGCPLSQQPWVFEEDLEAGIGVSILGVFRASSYDVSLCV